MPRLKIRRSAVRPLSHAIQKSTRHAALLAIAAATLRITPARADTLIYVHPSTGDWDSTLDAYSAWRDGPTLVKVPAPGDDAIVGISGTTGVSFTTINFNSNYSGTNGPGSFTLDSNNTINQTLAGSRLFVTGIEYLGVNGTATYVQSAGTHVIGPAAPMFMALNNGSFATYNLSGGLLDASAALAGEKIGAAGTATFTQSGGSNLANSLFLGTVRSLTNQATYTLNAGLLNTATFIAGAGGAGTFFLNGGTHLAGSLTLASTPSSGGTNPASFGAYTLGAAGNLHVTGDFIIGLGGVGSLTNSGNPLIDGTLYVGGANNGTGTVSHNAGTITAPNIVVQNPGSTFSVFSSAAAVSFTNFTQTNNAKVNFGFGTNPVDLDLNAALSPTPTYNLHSGTLTVTANAFIGDRVLGSVSATLNQFGGTANINQDLVVGRFLTNSGTVNQSGGVLNVTGNTIVGSNGVGTVNFSGGTLNLISPAGKGLYIGYTNAGSGSFNLSGSSLFLANNNPVYVGYYANGLYTQSGGAQSILKDLIVGGFATNSAFNGFNLGNGTVILSGGLLQPFGNTVVGSNGIGTFIQNGPSNFTPGPAGLTLGYTLTGSGTYTLSAGLLNATNTNIYVGLNGSGTYNQSGGTATAISFIAGYNASGTNFATGTVNLSGGKLSAINSFIAYNGNATVTLTGGTHTTNLLDIASSIDATALVTMSNTASLIVTGDEYMADHGVADFHQYGGTHTLTSPTNDFYNGRGSSASGIYYLHDGLLSINNRTEYLGYFGFGTINQTGGTNSLGNFTTGVLLLGYTNGAFGAYTLANSSLLTGAVVETVGSIGQGSFIQTGGSNITNDLRIAYNPFGGTASTSFGQYQLVGGTLTVNNTVDLGDGGVARFFQTGGTHTIASNLYVGTAQGFSGLYTLSAGTLQVGAIEFVGYSGSGTVSQSGGSHSAQFLYLGEFGSGNGTVNLSGGTLTTLNTNVGLSGRGNFFQTGGTHTTSGLSIGETSPSGLYSITNGTLTVLGDVFVGSVSSGHGTFNQSGGTTTITGAFRTFNGTNSTINLSSGTFTAASTSNPGKIVQTAGLSSFGPLTGAGELDLGFTSGPTARATVTSLSQTILNIKTTGLLTLAPNATRASNLVSLLSLAGNGAIDLTNQSLSLDATLTPLATVKSYVALARGTSGLWTGPGLNSSNVTANPQHLAIAIANGTSGVSAGGLLGRILVRPALIGDANLNGTADNGDISQLIARGHYLDGTTTNGWVDGDFNYDGKVDNSDISLLIASGNYLSGTTFSNASPPNAPRVASATTLSGSKSLAPVTVVGLTGDGIPDFQYDPATGDVKFRRDGLNAANIVGEVHIRSASGQLDPNQLPDGIIGSNGLDVTRPTEIDLFRLSVTGKFTEFADNYDLGPILQAHLTGANLLTDLTLTYTIKGVSPDNLPATLTGVPEPTSFAIIGLSTAGLLSRRRKQN